MNSIISLKQIILKFNNSNLHNSKININFNDTINSKTEIKSNDIFIGKMSNSYKNNIPDK